MIKVWAIGVNWGGGNLLEKIWNAFLILSINLTFLFLNINILYNYNFHTITYQCNPDLIFYVFFKKQCAFSLYQASNNLKQSKKKLFLLTIFLKKFPSDAYGVKEVQNLTRIRERGTCNFNYKCTQRRACVTLLGISIWGYVNADRCWSVARGKRLV